MQNWKKRWFVLTSDTLFYFKSSEAMAEGSSPPLGVLKLADCLHVGQAANRPSAIEFITIDRVYYMQASQDVKRHTHNHQSCTYS